MSKYKNPAIRQFMDQQVRFAPRDVRLAQIESAETLLHEIQESRDYTYQDLFRQITSYRPEIDRKSVV